jgi:parallel beta-helix repeat protein
MERILMNQKSLFICFVLLCTVLITPAEAKTWYVDDDGGTDFTGIQTAINSASSGDKIFVQSGTYSGFYVNTPNLSIIGESADAVTVSSVIKLPEGSRDSDNATGTVLKGMKITAAPLIGDSLGITSDLIIRDCVFEGISSSTPVSLKANRTIFENNVISNCTKSNALVLAANSCVIASNTIKNNVQASAIVLQSKAVNCTVKNNLIESNNVGFYFYKSGNENKIYSNSISNNSQITKILGTIPSTSWFSPDQIPYTYSGKTYTGYMGNYWSDYTVTDENGDGIGDTPYVLPNSLGTDNYPLIQPYENYFSEKSVLTSIEVTPASADLTTSSTQQFTASAKDQYGNLMSNISFNWSSSDEAVGTVNSTGFFTPLKAGTTTIIASAEGINGTSQVTVEETAITTISVSPLSSSLTPGGTQQFSAVAKDKAGNIIPDVAFNWSSDNESVGTIDTTGLFTAKDFGTATVTATNGTVNGTTQTTVTRTDLIADAIDAGTQGQGKQGNVNITVRNAGPAATGAFNVSLLADNKEVGRNTVAALGINESSSAVISWTPSSDGEVNLTAVVDPENTIDSSTDNNVLSKTVTVTSSSSDLSVSTASISTYPIYNNTLKVTIANSGGGNAAAFNVTAQIGEISKTVNIPELAAGSSTTFNVMDIKRQSGDTVPITVTIDPENAISEINETNNVYSTIATIASSGERYQGGRFSVGHDLVNNAVYQEGNIGVAIAVSNSYGSSYSVPGVTLTRPFTADQLKIPAGATIKSARIYQGWSWYGDPGFNLQFNGHESQEPVAKYADAINGQDVFDVTSYFNANDSNTAVLTSTKSTNSLDPSKSNYAYYGTVLIVVYEADSEPNRQIWVNEGSDCLLYGAADPYVGYTMINNGSTAGLVSAELTVVLESRDGDDGTIVTFNDQTLNVKKIAGADPSFMYFDATHVLQNGVNELGVNGSSSYTNYAASVLEVSKETTSEANFTSNVTSGNAPLNVKFTDTSTGTPTNWTWDFGDESTSTEQNPTHIYKSEGTYTVKLTVKNSLGSDSKEKTGYITVGSAVLAPVSNFSSNVTKGNAPLSVQFKDESTNSPTSWEWNFGDGKTSTEQNPSHTYETVGTYTVNLTAMNYGGSNSTTKTDYITITSDTSAPVASFTSDANSGQVPFTVKFTDTSTGKVSSWNWDFGDGSTSTDQNPIHTYVAEGSYTVTLTATGPGGSNTATSGKPIIASASLTSPSYNGGIPLTTAQNGTVSGGLWCDSYPGFSTSAQKAFTLPDYTKIKWARLYVTVYDGHMENNYRGNVSIDIDANGDSKYEIQKTETFDTTYSFPGTGGIGPVWLSDHMNRVTSDYLMWYDLTDLISGQKVNVQATTTKVDSSFDGRVKAMTLVVAYDDGDSDQVYYWVNQGHDTVNPLDDTYTGSTAFGTSTLEKGWSSANLTAIFLASVDGTYSFQGTKLVSGVKSGSYYGSNTWDISSLLTAGQDSKLDYNKQESNYYKVPLALMSVRYTSSSPELPTADFKADVTSGTAPLSVNFTEQSTGSPTSWLWDFGDGTNTTDQNVSHIYSSVGNYTVNLTVANADGSDSEVKTDYIVVSEPLPGAPVADFAATPTSGTAPLTVNFTDQSTGTVSSYSWDFNNDGTVDSSEQNPVYTYSKADNYTINLTVANEAGINSTVKANYITVSSAETNDLTIGSVNTVPGNAVFAREANTVKITDIKNTGTETLTNISLALYASDVSDGTVPVNTTTIDSLASGGTVTVSLIDPTIRNLEGDTVTYTAVVDPENLIPETNEANNNASVGKPVKYNGYKGKRYWEGGSDITTKQTYDLQGNLLYSSQPSSAYNGVGWTGRTETWTAADLPIPSGSTVEKALLYVSYNWDTTPGGVPKWTAAFNGNKLANGTLYTDKSNFGTYANYTYGLYVFDVTDQLNTAGNSLIMTPDSGNSNALYPSTLVVVYRNSNETRKQIFINDECDELAYSLTSYGTTLEEATAYAPFTGMSIETDKVSNATLYSFAGSAGPNEGNLLFNGKTVASNAWQGTSSTSSALVSDVKNYLNATDNEAGTQETVSGGMNALQQVLVVEYQEEQEAAPVANFTANVTTGTEPLTVQFTDASTGNASSYSWDFDNDGTVDSTEQNPVHIYNAAGNYTVNLTVANADGNDSEVKTEYIVVSEPLPGAPVANFIATPTSGTAPLTVTFKDQSSDTVSSYAWDFNNDGNVDSSEQNPSYTYSTAGTYTVNLTVTGPGGSDSEVKTGYVKVTGSSPGKPVAAFSASPASGKTPLTVAFTDKSSNIPTKWRWSFGDGASSTIQNPKHKYSKAGKYTVILTVTNAKGSNTVTETDYIKVIAKPVANFNSSITSGKAPLSVKFTDTSTGIASGWVWEFGDGSKSFVQNPTHKYSKAGTYTVSLTVKNAAGSNTVTKTEHIKVTAKPVSNFTSSVTSGKAPINIKFTDTSTGKPAVWKWSFGDGTSSTQQNPVHKYSKAGTYTVILTVKNAAGSNTVTKTDYIKVTAKPVAEFSATPTSGKSPLTVTFTDNSTGLPTKWKWNFGEGASSTVQSPKHKYSKAGSYTVTLTATNAAGSSTTTKTDYIKVTTNTK